MTNLSCDNQPVIWIKKTINYMNNVFTLLHLQLWLSEASLWVGDLPPTGSVLFHITIKCVSHSLYPSCQTDWQSIALKFLPTVLFYWSLSCFAVDRRGLNIF